MRRHLATGWPLLHTIRRGIDGRPIQATTRQSRDDYLLMTTYYSQTNTNDSQTGDSTMAVSRLLTLLLTAFISLTLFGCAGPQARDSVPAPTDIDASDYVIGPGDQLTTYVRNNPDISVNVAVRPDGKISVPMVQDIQAAGKKPRELAADLEEELRDLIRDPNVTVIVNSFVGTYDAQIRVIGQAVQPQALPYRDGMTVLDAIIQVGGLTQFAAGNRARLVRGTGDDAQSYRLRLNDLLSDGDMRHNHALRPGDILVIPEAFF